MSKLVEIFSRQIPSYIRDEYPKFVEFIRKYFEFVTDYTFSNKDIHDLQFEYNQIKVFLEAIKKEVAYNIPKPLVDESTIIQKIKELYVSKGSEEALRFLFRAFFGKEIEIFLPSSQILKPSDGQWIQDYSIFVRRIVGDPYDTVGKRVTVFNKKSKINLEVIRVNEIFGEEFINQSTVFDLGSVTDLIIERSYDLGFVTEEVTDILQVESIEEYNFNVYHELIIDRNYSGTYEVGDVVEFFENDTWYMGYIVPTITSYQVINGGKGFKLGQIVDIAHDGDPDGTIDRDKVNGLGCRFKVSRVGVGGSIEAIQMIKYGVEYPKSFMINVSSDPLKVVSKIYYAEQRKKIDFRDNITKYVSKGYVLKNFGYSFDDGCVVNVDILNNGTGYSHPIINTSPSPTGDHAILVPEVVGGQIVDVHIIKGGSGYQSCSASVFSDDYVDRAILQPILVGGTVVDVQIVNSGSGYKSISVDVTDSPILDNAILHPIVESGKIINFIIEDKGSGYITPPTITLSGDGVGVDAQFEVFLNNIYYTSIEYFGNIEGSFSQTIRKRSEEYSELATIKLVSGAVAKYPGYYSNNKGFVSDSIALIDSKYYQDFSYVIKSTIPYSEYASTVLSLTHLAGTKMFAEYSLESNINNVVDFVNKTNFRYQVNISDSASMSDTFSTFEYTPPATSEIVNDSFYVDDQGCMFVNPYNIVSDSGIDGYFSEDYSEGNECNPLQEPL